MMEYILISEASKRHNITIQALYQAIWRKALKHKKIEGVKYTSEEWLQEYFAHHKSKQLHSTFNGLKVFNAEKGEYSIKMVGEILNLHEQQVRYWMKKGVIKGYHKGYFWVISEEALQEAKKYFENVKEERKFA